MKGSVDVEEIVYSRILALLTLDLIIVRLETIVRWQIKALYYPMDSELSFKEDFNG